MNGWSTKLSRAMKVADSIEKGVTEKSSMEADLTRAVAPVKHYTVYSIQGEQERPIAWRLYSADIPHVIAAAQRRMVRAYESILEGDPLYVYTRYEAREAVWS